MPVATSVTSHDVAERARLISHRIYAEQIELQPQLIDEARGFLERGIAENGGTMGHNLWQLILTRPWSQVRDRMLQDDAEGRLLRSNSPFSHLIGIQDESIRRQIWRKAKAELCNPATLSEQSAA